MLNESHGHDTKDHVKAALHKGGYFSDGSSRIKHAHYCGKTKSGKEIHHVVWHEEGDHEGSHVHGYVYVDKHGKGDF